ncbi:MAG TPA: hypothetical protein VKK31_05455 [Thermoanaerobaculia bacterium]|nr:hypothetical protein [Thermoanaerobaculia bacterium]
MNRKGALLRGIAAAALLALAVPQAWADDAPAAKIDAKTAFDKLKGLAGDWNGSAKGGVDGQELPSAVVYRTGSNGSVVTETSFPGTDHEMMTVYFLQGNDLVATHYCAAGNQPHFKLDLAKSSPTELVFAFDGGTNLDPAKDGHVHDGRLGFAADGKLDSAWTFYAGGEKKGQHEFHLTRK